MPEAKLVIDHLRKAYPGPLPVLEGVAFDVAPGEFVSVIGPSGCGKSTLFNVVAGLEPPDAGRVLVDGEDATGRTDPFAYMPQQDLLFPWRTVLGNATLGLEVAGMSRRAARARVQPLFAPFGLAGFEHADPDELSGGMRQRAALLRTVVQDRAVLLLDEPFGALDSLTRTDMQTWLDGVRARFDWTVLLITHDIREAVYLSDRVVVLGPRPTSVLREVPVDLPRPRSIDMITTARFSAIERLLLQTLRSEPLRGVGRSHDAGGVRDYRLRPAEAGDSAALYELHRATMRAYVESVYGPWDEDAQEAIHRSWMAQCTAQVIEVDGCVAGVVDVEWRAEGLHLARIEVTPPLQNRGLGTAVVEDLVRLGADRPVTLDVFDVNPARALYGRLGFQQTGVTGRKIHMRRACGALT